jgi:hypothetical protein
MMDDWRSRVMAGEQQKRRYERAMPIRSASANSFMMSPVGNLYALDHDERAELTTWYRRDYPRLTGDGSEEE